MANGVSCIELPASDLVPREWQAVTPTYVFNPAVAAHTSGLIAFYRVVSPELGRKIAACRLDATFRPIPGSARPFSDEIGSDNPWYADPRVYVLRSELFVYWNTGFPSEGNNEQYLVRVDAERLSPTGSPIRLEIEGSRERIEKNWILFENEADIYAIYSITPHRVLRLKDWNSERMLFADAATTFWNAGAIANRYGIPRGGAQPLRRGDKLYHFCHASVRFADGSIYVPQCYEFDAAPPFALTRFTADPLPLPNPRGERYLLPKLNPRVRSVVYPAGNVALEEDRILLSYGVNDEAAFVATIPFAEIERKLVPVKAVSALRSNLQHLRLSLFHRLARRMPASSSGWPAKGIGQ